MKSLMRKVRKSAKSLGRGQKGFTLIEVLVVVAILGVLAAVAVPSVASFIGTGDDAAKDTELHDVQTAVTALMAAEGVGTITAVAVPTSNMSSITAGTSSAADYMVGLEDTLGDGTQMDTKTGALYTVDANGIVSQS